MNTIRIKRGKVVLHSVALDIFNSQQEWERIKEPWRKKINKEHTKKMYNIKNYDKMEMIQETRQLKKKYFLRTYKTK